MGIQIVAKVSATIVVVVRTTKVAAAPHAEHSSSSHGPVSAVPIISVPTI